MTKYVRTDDGHEFVVSPDLVIVAYEDTVLTDADAVTIQAEAIAAGVKLYVYDTPQAPLPPPPSEVATVTDSVVADLFQDVDSLTFRTLEDNFTRIGRRDLRSDGVPSDGVQAADVKINALITQYAASKTPVKLGPGTYRMTNQLLLRDDLDLYLDPGAFLLFDFVSTVSSAGSFIRNADLAVKVKNVKLTGPGQIGVSSWACIGNMFGVRADYSRFADFTVTSWSGARLFVIAGDDISIDGITAYGAPAAAGNGGIRYMGGSRFRCENCNVVSGDDVYQLVPGGAVTDTNFFDQSIYDAQFSDSVGISTAARLMCAAVQSGPDAPGVVMMQSEIRSSGFSNIRGRGTAAAIVIQNLNSSGHVADILVEGCSVDMIGGNSPTADILIMGATNTGMGQVRRVTIRDTIIRNASTVALQTQNQAVVDTLLENCHLKRSTRTDTGGATNYVCRIAGSGTTIRGGTIDGNGADADIISLNNVTSSFPDRTIIEDVRFTGIGAVGSSTARYAIRVANTVSPRIEACRFDPTPGAEANARAFNIINTTTGAYVGRNDGTKLTATTKHVDAGVGTVWATGTNRGLTEPTVAAPAAPGGGISVLSATLSTDTTPVVNTNSLSVTGLTVTLAANSVYRFNAPIFYDASTTADFRIGWVVPSGATGSWTPNGPVAGATNTQTTYLLRTVSDIATVANIGGFNTAGTPVTHTAEPNGIIRTGASGGSFTLRYAQSVATADEGAVLRANSSLIVTQLSGPASPNQALVPNG